MTVDPVTPTPSLQRRVVVVVIGLLAALLVVLGVVIDVSLRAQARRDLNDRLLAATSRADALAQAHTPPQQIAAQLNGGVVRALVITADGIAYGDPAISPDPGVGAFVPPPPPPGYPPFGPPPGYPPPPPGGPPAPPAATATELVHPLPDGARLVLVADTTQTTQVTRQLRELMIGAGVVTLLVAALLSVAVSRVALRPLDRLTALATDIATGDRGRRLRPKRTDTELGRAAGAFDGMLEVLEASERRARGAAADARRAEAATRRFLVDAAHELRTPIAGIQVAAEQLASNAGQHQHDAAARGQYRRATLLLSDARRAGRLVGDMLDLSRIDAGLPLDVHDVDLAAVVDAEADRTTMLAPRVTVVRTGLAELAVKADPTRVAQILGNLLDNARRYTPAGGAINVDLRASDHTAEVTVTDTGPGIPDDERDRIFERLVRLDAGRARDHGGAGLGLPIARALARAHGGELSCLSREGGAQFRLSLPVGAASAPPA
ncbi:two-component sensor histidine kinase [Mycobacterium sp. 852002-50816_SCH5313054-b]|uniref:sensor histidine kinase n=1 Tax=Mycobacterium sp. 852002-50816_SCH5313054-b TaxID=1834092 RepID=UPI0007FD9F03|nr:HAMP domain-containing sensor histidine kinase [Mycobacterium sp. 852002-50816_SCH5313054-b]OBF52845.1 two-component sensor histidine kinase [Mycobacterium sp. 852002-50816_SCH5313054-b]